MAKWKSLTMALIPAVTALAFVAPAATAATAKFQQFTFTLSPGGSYSFKLPVIEAPVRIEVSFTADNGGTQTPSEIMYAVVNEDPDTKQETWVGTNNNGTQTACNSQTTLNCLTVADAPFTPSDTIIAAIDPVDEDAILEVDDQAAGALEIKQSATSTSIDGHYVVNLWW
jgi:hypothetical protein